MISNLPLQLRKAVELFEEFERAVDHERKTKSFSEAVSIIDNHLLKNQKSPHKEFLVNLKLTYTRKLLEIISENSDVPAPNEDWFSYLWLTLGKCKNEVEKLTKENPSLKESYGNFIEMWGDDAMTVLERRRRELQRRQHQNV